MDIFVVPITKDKLEMVPEVERAFYLHMGHLRNEIMMSETSIGSETNSLFITHLSS